MTTDHPARSHAVVLRTLRAITGLYLLAYVTMHLVNLSLGIFSVEMMNAAQPYLSGVWTGPVLGYLLLAALVVHYVLGIWATYQRPSLVGTPQDLVQALSGLLVIPLLATHVVGVVALKNSGIPPDYELLNRVFWLGNPAIGLVQVLLISVVWVHGCAGFFMLLRARPTMVTALPWLYPIAVAIPVLALLGYTQAGRTVMIQGLPPVFDQVPNADGSLPTAVSSALVAQVRNAIVWGALALAALVLVARLLRNWLARPGTVTILTEGVGTISAQTGQTMLDAFRAEDQPHASLCSGRGRCGTCAVRVVRADQDLPPITPLEQATLDRTAPGVENVRLACQMPLYTSGNIEVARLFPPDYTFDSHSPAPAPRKEKALV